MNRKKSQRLWTRNISTQSFLAHLGNELATPLHGALGHLELVDRSSIHSDDRERLAIVDESLRTLSSLLDGLMQFAAAEGAAPRT